MIYRRRMLFLFVFGILHGIFFYFGDITQMYAVAGLVLLLYVDRDVAGLGRAARNWWIGDGGVHCTGVRVDQARAHVAGAIRG